MMSTKNNNKIRRWGYAEVSLLIMLSMMIGATFPRKVSVWNHLVQRLDNVRPKMNPSSHLRSNHDGPKLAWLLSFPNSGTSYTLKLINTYSETLVGCNYDNHNRTAVPIFSDQPQGPFVIDPSGKNTYQLPESYVLTKSHCGGRCERCPPVRYTETTYSFRQACLRTKFSVHESDGHWKEVTSYYQPNKDKLAKAVHLIRNPFDNVVSRFHLERNADTNIGDHYENDREGFRIFCRDVVDIHLTQAVWLTSELDRLTQSIPCRADLFRYAEWHNLAFYTTDTLELDTYILKYDWYETRYNATVQELVHFLELPHSGAPWPFQKGKRYDYFTKDERRRIGIAMEYMASPSLWEHLRDYFD